MSMTAKRKEGGPAERLITDRGSFDGDATEKKRKTGARGTPASSPEPPEPPRRDQFSFIYDVLSKAKSDTEFIYLNNVAYHAQKGGTWNPYNLEIVPFAKVNQSDYYTISASGVTHFVNGIADYTPLDQWKREQYLFGLIMEIPFFRMYKSWKSFTIWRKTIRDKKIVHCKGVLEKSLFILNPVFRQSLLEVRELCSKIAKMKLQASKSGVTFTLMEYLKVQEQQKKKALDELLTFQDSVLVSVKGACDKALEIFEKESEGGENSQLDGSAGYSQRLPPIKGATGAGESLAFGATGGIGGRRTYVQMAQLRKEYKKIVNFMRLADYMVLDTLHALVVDATTEMLHLFENKRKEEIEFTKQQEAAAAAAAAAAAEAAAGGKKEQPKKGVDAIAGQQDAAKSYSPLYLVEVLFADDELTLAPSGQEYMESVEAVINDFITTASSVVKLVTHEELRPFIEPVINGQQQRMLEETEGFEIKDLIEKNDEYARVISSIKDNLTDNYGQVDEFVLVFEPYKLMFLENAATDIQNGFREAALNVFRDSMLKYKAQMVDVDGIQTSKSIGIFRIDSKKLKEVLTPSPQKCLKEIHILLPQLARDKNNKLLEEINNAQEKLASNPDNVSLFVDFSDFLRQTIDRLDEYQSRFKAVQDMYELMAEQSVKIEDDDKACHHMLEQTLSQLRYLVSVIEAGQEEKTQRFSQDIDKGITNLRAHVEEIAKTAQDPQLEHVDTPIDDAIKFLEQLSETFDAAQKEAKEYERYQQVLNVPVVRVEEVDSVGDEIKMKRNLWHGRRDWDAMTAEWNAAHFDSINADEINNHVAKYNKIVMQCERGLPDNPVVPILKSKVVAFKNTVPVVYALRNPALKERHWGKIEGTIGAPIVRDDKFTLGYLMNLKVMDFKEAIEQVSTEATNEAVLEEMLAKVKNAWNSQEFVPMPYKDFKEVYILGGVDEVIAALEESQVTIQTILGSRYVAPLRTNVEDWERKLRLMSETLDEWLACQRQWMYLESIFGAPDIQKQLPQEAKMFNAVDKSWKSIMKRTNDERNAMKATTAKGLLETFQSHNGKLDKIQKSLEDYLETKRKAFPRFYFLSNDELLEILAQTKNPQAVQPHLRKCFDNIYKLDFGDDPKSIDIFHMLSGEGEKVQLGKNLKARGNIEDWLSQVEKSMFESLKRRMKQAVQDYPKRPREEWIREHPAQCVVSVGMVYWCQGIADAFASSDPMAAMQEFYDLNVQQLTKLAELVRGQLTPIERLIIIALITQDVHARDIVMSMIRSKITSINDFAWQMQLRYYWDTDEDDLLVRQSNSVIHYGYEYMGAMTRLVITPLTDRCYMTITGALHVQLGAAPAGPAGTGKTETVKDLAKGLGRQCVVFNCSDQLDYKMLGKLFAGLAQAGSWTCLDEFNRINIEVLSVVAQQLLTIRRALLQKATRFTFEGSEISLKNTCGVFITMNPGYAGRTELPDNLKALFRPVSMMVPDYGLIAEIMLFAEGFAEAKTLSQKMVKMYKLCSEQLSQQDHYDFGMRQVKSVLVMAGALKRGNPTLSEDVVLIRALRDSNVPRFLAEDLPLFQNIITDLFPSVHIPSNDYGELEVAIRESITEHNLQLVEPFILKVIQLFETFNVRFGVMLVGPTGGGKSRCYQMLKAAMTKLREQGSDNDAFQKVFTYVLNPKSITMGELYGEFNKLTNEWTDGLASSIVREVVGDTTDNRKWVVFDGPVDALWIENMNTVLDDNMTLCLANGERIKLNKTMRMLFEVQDLAVASPATVSRCGMVYLTPSDLGWRPYVLSWLPEFNPKFPEELRAHLLQHFDEAVPKGLQYVRKEGKELVPSVDINLVTSLCALFKALVADGQGVDFTRPVEDLKPLVSQVFVMAYIWSLGANFDADSMLGFDSTVRDVFGNINMPASDLMFDYYLDVPTGTFKQWREIVPNFVYKREVPYFQLLVPTVDTTRYAYFLERLFLIEKSCLVTGVTGVGKSVVIQDMLMRLSEKHAWQPVEVGFSAQTDSRRTQETIEGKLDKKRKTLLGGPPGKKVILFVDDVNMPALEVYGAQPPVELLRQFLDFGGFYDRHKLFWKKIEDVTICAACGPPGGGRNPLTPRFVRHFNLMCIPPPSNDTLRKIFAAILGGFFEVFVPDIRGLCLSMVDATVEVYERISKDLLPIPAKSHYTFNLRDISKVFQGVLMAKPTVISHSDQMVRLWMHECLRVFHDRLINNEDKNYFTNLLAELLKRIFKLGWTHEDVFEKQPLLFGDFLKMGVPREERNYEEFKDMKKVAHLLEDYLDEYNLANKEMKLVFFNDAIEHIARISRILRQPRGNAMLVGVGGSGKQSLTRLASFIAEYKIFQIELTKGYGYNEFREDLKKLYNTAGVLGEPVTFLFTDTQIVRETFLEDINNILNSGEVPNLFAQDEMDKIINDVRPHCKKLDIPDTRDNVRNLFVSRVRDNLHIVLCMSPVGEAFRTRCRMFPSLVNCCTIDWFSEWPKDALLSVSKKFLANMELGNRAELRGALAEMCAEIHYDVIECASLFYQQLRRRFYVTPKSYLELVNLYMGMIEEKREELSAARDRLNNGLTKLNDTNALVAQMQGELQKLQPILVTKSAETAKLLEVVTVEKAKADEKSKVVAMEKAQVEVKAEEVKVLADDARKDLDEALPALNGAIEALNSLNKNDINEIKSFAKPPELVQKVMESVLILLEKKPDWASAKQVLSDTQFMNKLVTYDKDNIPEAVIKKVKKYIDDEQFKPEIVEKVSKAAKSLCLWVRAMDVYYRVAKVVEPKRMNLKQMEDKLAAAQKDLDEKQEQLQRELDNVENLSKTLVDAQEEKGRLEEAQDTTKKRLQRAEKLTVGLADEAVRWAESVQSLTQQIDDLVGNVFLSSACIAYFGAFTSPFRKQLVEGWVAKCEARGIPVMKDFNLNKILADPVVVRDWNIWGLPTDDFSTENGILVTRGRRWPLMIDPQGQANKWVKNMESKNGLKIIKMTDANFLRTLESSIRLGSPVLLEDIGEELDPSLEPILQKQIFKQGGRTLIRVGDSDVEYDPKFKFYMTTKLANPHYLPEVCIKVTIINFTVTLRGLEDQLLGNVVRFERPDLENQKNHLVVTMAGDKKQLKDLEDKILRLLSQSEGNILDDVVLINTLSDSKLTAGVIQQRVKESEETEKSINLAREGYRKVANRGSILYFVIADLALIDPMYQFSLTYFIKLFDICLALSPKADDLPARLQSLIDTITVNVFNNVCRGLFEQHKTIFSFVMCAQIMRNAGDISDSEWNVLLRGPVGHAHGGEKPANPAPEWISEIAWEFCIGVQHDLVHFKDFCADVAQNVAAWKAFFESENPHMEPLPGKWNASLHSFQKLIVLKAFREEKLLFAIVDFVRNQLGKAFTESPPLSLPTVFNDTTKGSPIIFILSQGADPVGTIMRFAKERDYSDRLHAISLGQGQGPIAAAQIAESVKSGDWVLLQNCHLAASWMGALEKIVEGLGAETTFVHEDFRLWLTSMPSRDFPVPVLQSGVKLTFEPPRGIRANLMGTYSTFSEQEFESCSKPQPWKKLLFGLAFFHAVVQERRKFGPLGWNIRYEFNNSDFEVAMATLKMFLEEQEEIPWKALLYVTGEINYGGRVTDDLDRRCLNAILEQYYTPAVLEEGCKFTPSGVYYAPEEAALGVYKKYIDELPYTDTVDIFGMHENANISFQRQETGKVIDTALSIQPRFSGTGGGKSNDDVVMELAIEILAKLPKSLDRAAGGENRFSFEKMDSLTIVLGQEMDRFNRLLSTMKRSLEELQKAIKGLIVMTLQLDDMFTAILNNRVPAIWEKVAYPSLKPLGSWVKDLHARVAFMRTWLLEGHPKAFWLPGFFFPQGFMTGALQMYARKYKIPINTLNFGFKVLDVEHDALTHAPEDGVYCYGFYMDGARWDRKARVIQESFPGEMYSPMPVIHFTPQVDYEPPPSTYGAPLYKTSVRAGVLSTTGQSTNFVIQVDIPTDRSKSHWILQGVALLCALND
eukprot:tig00000404_g400.t1